MPVEMERRNRPWWPPVGRGQCPGLPALGTSTQLWWILNISLSSRVYNEHKLHPWEFAMDVCYVGLLSPAPPSQGSSHLIFSLPNCSAPILQNPGRAPIIVPYCVYSGCPSRSFLHPALCPRNLAEWKLVAEQSLGRNNASIKKKKKKKKISFFLFLAVLGLRCWSQATSSCEELGQLFLAVLRLLIVVASVVAEHGLQVHRFPQLLAHGLLSCDLWTPKHWLTSHGTQAQLLRGMQDPLSPGIEPVYPALQGRFLTTRPPGKPQNNASNDLFSNKKSVPALPILSLSQTQELS